MTAKQFSEIYTDGILNPNANTKKFTILTISKHTEKWIYCFSLGTQISILLKQFGRWEEEADRYKVYTFLLVHCQEDKIFSGFIFPNHIFDNMLHALFATKVVILGRSSKNKVCICHGKRSKNLIFYYPAIG